MALRSELKELLADFEKRMKFINIVRCVLDYKYPDVIRKMFPDKLILDNVIISVLVYIKDRTLGTEQNCTLADIENFLDDLSVVLPNVDSINAAQLARYIVVEVLQNGGILTEFLTFNSKTESFEPMSVRLLNEEKGCYHLTDDAFDFLFRSKEIESELDYSVTRFRMKEYMRRDNYGQALEASRELVSRIRNMKLSMDDFLLRCREDISKITVDQYENVIAKIRSLLESEYTELTVIQEEAKNKEKSLSAAQDQGVEDIQKNKAALHEIIQNIALTIEQQRVLINKKTSLAEAYQELIRDNFSIDRFQRMDFEKDILSPLRSQGAPLGDAAKFLLFMLSKPVLAHQFSLENFYAPQGKWDQAEEEEGIDITAEDTDLTRQIEIRNLRNRDIIQDIFHFMLDSNQFSAKDFVLSLPLSKLLRYCEENTLPNVLLSMYAMQELDIEDWNDSQHFTVIPNGEFELSWCLEEIPKALLNMKKIVFTKQDEPFSFEVKLGNSLHHIDMTNFEIEVIR